MATVLPDISSSRTPYDKKEYRQIVLPNGLRAILVQDTRALKERDMYDDSETESETDDMSTSQKSSPGSNSGSDDGEGDDDDEPEIRFAACSLLTGVGSFSDPADLPGLAHFLEHMLFMGTTKYPDENHYDAYVSKNGGETNAWTDLEETCYHFTIPQQQLMTTLDVFSRFFYEPLMREDAVGREKQAVESEFKLSLQSDSARLQQLFCATAKPLAEHPFSTFSWGNEKSLSPPGVDVVAELRKFYDMYYYAQNMRLVLIGGYTLDELQEAVLKCFSPIPSAPRIAPTLPITHNADHSCTSPLLKFGNPFPATSLSKIYYMLPIKQCHSLTLTFQLPPQQEFWKSLPTNYIGHLLGHEGGGSILSLIKGRGWASGIVAGVGEGGQENASSHCLFQIQVMMSESGVAHAEDILEMISSYINMLKDTYLASNKKFPAYIFEELKSTHEMAYNFASEEQPEDFVENLVTSLSPCRSYPPEYLLTGGELLFEEDAGAVMNILKALVIENARVDVMSSLWGVAADFEEPTAMEVDDPPPAPTANKSVPPPLPDYIASLEMQTEPIFGTKYWATPLAPETVARLKAPRRFEELSLPAPNPYIATNFEMRPFPPGDAAHPLLNACVKVAMSSGKKNKFGTFYPATVTKFNEKNKALSVVFEDEGEKDLKLDDAAAFFKDMEEDSTFTCDGGKTKVRIVSLVYDGRFGDGINDEDVDDDKMFPPIPPAPPATRLPQVVFDKASVKVHHLQDRLFNRPQSELRVKLMPDIDRSSPLEAACGDLLQMLVADAVTETVYMASVCELFYDLSHSSDGYFSFKFNGFNDKLGLLADYVLRTFLEFRGGGQELPSFLGPTRFATGLESLIRWYANTNLKTSSMVSDIRVRCLIEKKISENRKAAALEGLDVPGFMKVVNKMLGKIGIEAFFHGNCDGEEGKKLGERLSELLGASGGGKGKRKGVFDEVKKIPTRAEGELARIVAGSKNVKEPNNGVEHYFQMNNDNTRERVVVDLLTQIMYEPMFDQIRTKEQFGYSVSCGARWTGAVIGVTMKIVSAVKTVDECSSRMDKFLVDFQSTLRDMKDSDFMSNVVSLAKIKLQVWNGLGEHGAHLWSEITCGRYAYNCLLDEVKELRGVTKAEVLGYYEKRMMGTGRRLLRVNVVGGGGEWDKVACDLEAVDMAIKEVYKKGGRWEVKYKN